MLDQETFATVVASTPLVSIDLVVRATDSAVLLGLRNNPPAQSSWFVPGGRIFKDETHADAVRRISQAELGRAYSLDRLRFLGVFEHLYQDNCFGTPGFGTHYVVLAYELRFNQPLAGLPQSQHQAFCWWRQVDLLKSADVHPYTKAYFQFDPEQVGSR
ncbi:MAG: GDP-mannose mannosyl hydrolase [Gammaproteobacteria bacterium]|nr:GDP-mannose mannosyl hydrolase [Gammaproteobacteria bacterium]